MGQIMKHDDIYIASLLEMLNLRFAPPQGTAKDLYGGIQEMVAIQKEFNIFKVGRSFRDSVAVLGVGALVSAPVRFKWFALLEDLRSYPEPNGENGDTMIVKTIIANLGSRAPLPVYFTAHDSRPAADLRRVLITSQSQPIFYMDQTYVTISLPMRPKPKPRSAASRK